MADPRLRHPAAADPSPPEEDPWRLPRHLGLAALAVVGALVGAGWLLHWWGPLNPRIGAWASTSTASGSTDVEATVRLANESLTELTITDGRVALAAAPVAGSPVEAGSDLEDGSPLDGTEVLLFPVEVHEDGESWSTSVDDGVPLPAVLAPGEVAVLRVIVDRPPCNGANSWTSNGSWSTGSLQVLVGVRSSWGRETTRAYPVGSLSVDCAPGLPPETSAPADRTAAVAEIQAAFRTAYDSSLDQATREAPIDDPRGLAEAAAEAMAGPFAAEAVSARPTVTDVSFDRPGHATVVYDLGQGSIRDRVGEAVLVEGTWKVTRATVCFDLALAAATCPPLLR
jgi:hypothetical protein